jgi:hypothetical protein
MRWFSPRKPSPAMAVAFIALLAALSGTAVALPGKNTVDSGDIKKNAVKSSDIAKGAVKTADLANNAVRSAKVRNNTLTGNDINESTLGKVPSAASADNAANAANAGNAANAANAANANRAETAGAVDGRAPFQIRLASGQTQTVATNGPVSIVAQCLTDAGNDIIRLLAATSQDGAVMDGNNDHTGAAADFLNIATPEAQRVLVLNAAADGTTNVQGQIDQGYVMAADGSYLGIDSESTALGLNYSGSECIATGVVNSIG